MYLLPITCKKDLFFGSVTCSFVVELFKQFYTLILLLLMLGNVNNKVMQFGRMSLRCELELEDLLSVSNSLIRV